MLYFYLSVNILCNLKVYQLVVTFLTLYCISDAATDPTKGVEDWDAINKFCDQVNNELEGPQYATRLLAHKIQSPIERESLYALAVRKFGSLFIYFHLVL